jgi:hypothetical protein
MRFKSTIIFCLVIFLFCLSLQADESLKSEIYSKIKCCACKEPFETCGCLEAKEMKGYLEALLDEGVSKEEIFYKLAKRFSLNVITDEAIKQVIEKRLIQETGQIRPKISLDSVFYDFGNVSKKQGQINKVFKLSNEGNAPLIIKGLKTSCPCAFVSLKANKNKSPYFGTVGTPPSWQVELPAGQGAELELMLDLASSHVKIGKIVRAAIIVSNDPLYPEQIVRVEVDVKE